MPASPSLRDQSGHSIIDVAEKLGWQGSRISRIGTRQLGVTAPDLRKLLDAYGVEDEAYRNRLAEWRVAPTIAGGGSPTHEMSSRANTAT